MEYIKLPLRKGVGRRENKNPGINKQLLFLALLVEPLLHADAALQDALFNLRDNQSNKSARARTFTTQL